MNYRKLTIANTNFKGEINAKAVLAERHDMAKRSATTTQKLQNPGSFADA